MALVDVTIYYVEMLAASVRLVPAPRDGLAIIHAKKPTVPFYRFLYDGVGKDYHWYSRGRLADADLAAVVQHPLNEVHVLYIEGTPAGFAELDRRNADDVELVQFGLMAPFIGQGLGRHFLQW